MKRTAYSLAILVIAAGIIVPGANLLGEQTPAVADEGTVCEVTAGQMSWGVKEAFRSYISGTIANGEWTVSDGAGYETPQFTFGSASGDYDTDTGEGSVSFAGTVNFTGHDGVLNLTIANPTIEFAGDGTARLLLDTRSNNADGETAIDSTQVPVGKIENLGAMDPSSGTLTVSDASTVLTAEGAEAFSGFYATGEELDPISLTLEVTPCAAGSTAAAPDEPSADDAVVPDEDPGLPWLPIAIGAAALVAIAVAVTLLITGRNRGSGSTDAPTEE